MEKSQLFVKQGISSIFFLIVLCIAIYSYIKPYYSYDLIPYTASTLSIEMDSPEKIHDETYKIIKEKVPGSIFEAFTTGEFGKTMLNDSTSFYQQLNFYKVKPLYIYLIFMLHKIGMNIVNAIHLISVISYLGISFILFLFIRRLKSSAIATLILTILMLCQPFIIIAAQNTPDSLSAFVLVLSLYLFLNQKSKLLPGILLVLSIAIRPDNAIIAVILMIYFGLFAPKTYRLKFLHMVGLVLSSFIVYFAIGFIEHSYGWSTLFTIAFIHFVETPAETMVHVSINDYFGVLFSNGFKILTTHILYVFIMGFFGLLVSRKNLVAPVYNHLIKIILGTMILFFLLFPSAEVDRYFTTEYLIIIICSLNILGNTFIQRDQIKSIDIGKKAIS